MSEPNIREYNFAIPGNIDRHIPGIPGVWPVGSVVAINEDANEVVSVSPEGAQPMIPTPPQKEEEAAQPDSEQNVAVAASAGVAQEPAPETPLQGEIEPVHEQPEQEAVQQQ